MYYESIEWLIHSLGQSPNDLNVIRCVMLEVPLHTPEGWGNERNENVTHFTKGKIQLLLFVGDETIFVEDP
jgi:hypothetical protein